ncbi:DUF6653 family protein [Halorussus salinus]|uniref:DUF6653 family protein n=1 Tax=Halorussus salinus TaxID=1364935 RepID=UPI001092689D|nr:DUF6653 family protein [Halorussus salinus]
MSDVDWDDGFAERYFWSGHANSRSVWTAVAAFPTLVAALYRRDGSLFAATLLVVVGVTLSSPSPEDDEAWATRVVLGERAWLDEESPFSREGLFVALSAPVVLFTIRAAVRRRLVGTVIGTVVSMVLMLVFFRQMVAVYKRRNERVE